MTEKSGESTERGAKKQKQRAERGETRLDQRKEIRDEM